MFTPETREFLERFFSSPNLITWEMVESGALGKLSPFISRLEGDSPLPTVLPFMECNKSLTWFALASNETLFIQLREQVRSFIGSTYSDFSYHRASGVPHPMDSIANVFTNGHFFTFRGNDAQIGENLNLLFQLLQKRPDRRSQIPRDPYPLLRNFELALQAMDYEIAEAQINSLERYHLIDPRNALFMRIDLLTRFKRWEEILAHPQMDDLLKASRPARITEGIIRAVYAVHLKHLENDPEAMKENFSQVVWPQYQSLYRVRGSLSHPESLISFMLRAIDPASTLPDLRDELLLAGVGSNAEQLLKDLVKSTDMESKSAARSTNLSIARAKSLADQGRFEEAFTVASKLPVSKEQIQLMLVCAFEIQELTIDKQVAEAVSHLDEAERKSILTSRQLRACYEYLKTRLLMEPGTNQYIGIPGNWNEWFDCINDLDPYVAINLAKRGADEWARDGFLTNQDEIERILVHLRNHVTGGGEPLDSSLPYLLRYFINDPKWPRIELKPVYTELHHYFLSRMRGIREEMKIAADWANLLLDMGLTVSEYKQLFKDLTLGWGKFASPDFLQALYPFLTKTSIRPRPDMLSCLRFIHQVRHRLMGSAIVTEQTWLDIENRLIPQQWETWYRVLYEADEDYYFLADWLERIEKSYDTWTPSSIHQINEWITQWILDEPENGKKGILGRSLTPFTHYVTQDPDFPENDETEFYENLADAIRLFAGKNEDTVQILIKLLEGLLQKKPEATDTQWRNTRNWMTFQPIPNLLKVVFEFMELFHDFGVLGMEIKPFWDKWLGHLFDKLDENTVWLIPYLTKFGEEVMGDYLILQELRQRMENVEEGEDDPLKQLPSMTITIFSCREKAARRAAERIMQRNERIKARVCTHDRATDQTTAYARQSDLSIVVTACISHALTYGIRDELRADPIYPRSSGEAGIIERFEAYAKERLSS